MTKIYAFGDGIETIYVDVPSEETKEAIAFCMIGMEVKFKLEGRKPFIFTITLN